MTGFASTYRDIPLRSNIFLYAFRWSFYVTPRGRSPSLLQPEANSCHHFLKHLLVYESEDNVDTERYTVWFSHDPSRGIFLWKCLYNAKIKVPSIVDYFSDSINHNVKTMAPSTADSSNVSINLLVTVWSVFSPSYLNLLIFVKVHPQSLFAWPLPHFV